MMRVMRAFLASVIAVSFLASCQSVYYGTWEKLGYHKRDILVERVEDAQEDQEEAKEQFQTALGAFTDVVEFDGGELQDLYERLNDELEECRDQASTVNDRIEAVQDVSDALFEEWEEELDDYASEDLRQKSAAQLRETQDRCAQLIGAMRRAESKMEPVLTAFNDQVLFLKHNLNAQAIASLEGEVTALESDIAELVAAMEMAIEEADTFIQSMGGA